MLHWNKMDVPSQVLYFSTAKICLWDQLLTSTLLEWAILGRSHIRIRSSTFCRWLDLNGGSLVPEATALPTDPQLFKPNLTVAMSTLLIFIYKRQKHKF